MGSNFKAMKNLKDLVAKDRGYPNWEEMENFIIDHNFPVVVAQLLVSAMEEVAIKTIDECINKVKQEVRPHCNDHTPYWGNCVSCGMRDNYDQITDTDDLIDELQKLKSA